MNRWRHRLDQLRDEARARPYGSPHAVQNVRNVQSHVPTHILNIPNKLNSEQSSPSQSWNQQHRRVGATVEEDCAATRTAQKPVVMTPSNQAEEGGAAKDPTWWRDQYEERAAVRQFDGSYSRDEAELLAWSEIENRWHLDNGERVPHDICAGCRRAINDAEALDLIDGCRVHASGDDGHDCLIRHGERWRRVATRGLAALGLERPAGMPRADWLPPGVGAQRRR